MEELIRRALKIGAKANRIALVDSSIYLNPSDDLLNTFNSVVIIKGLPFTKSDTKIKKNKEVENGTE